MSWKNDGCFQRAVKVLLHYHTQRIPGICDTSCLDLGSWLCTWPFSLALVWTARFPNQVWDSWDQGVGRGNCIPVHAWLKRCHSLKIPVSPKNGLWDLIWDLAHLPLALQKLAWTGCYDHIQIDRDEVSSKGSIHHKPIFGFPVCSLCGAQRALNVLLMFPGITVLLAFFSTWKNSPGIVDSKIHPWAGPACAKHAFLHWLLFLLALIGYECVHPECSIQCPWEKKKTIVTIASFMWSEHRRKVLWSFPNCFSAPSNKWEEMLFAFPPAVEGNNCLESGRRM